MKGEDISSSIYIIHNTHTKKESAHLVPWPIASGNQLSIEIKISKNPTLLQLIQNLLQGW